DKRLAASSKLVRVRVEFSKKRLITVLPRSVGTFLTSRFEISRKFSAVSSIPLISSAERSRMPKRSRLLKGFSILSDQASAFMPKTFRYTKKARSQPCFNKYQF